MLRQKVFLERLVAFRVRDFAQEFMWETEVFHMQELLAMEEYVMHDWLFFHDFKLSNASRRKGKSLTQGLVEWSAEEKLILS